MVARPARIRGAKPAREASRGESPAQPLATLDLTKHVERIVRSRFATGDAREVDYAVRLAPGSIAKVRVERLGPHRARIHWVHVPPAYRGCGLGGDLLALVLRDADRERLTVTLAAKACGTMPQRPLERWYESYGFRGRERDADGGLEMSRRPAASRVAVRPQVRATGRRRVA